MEELQEANVLSVPSLLRGSVRSRMKQSVNPSKWRLAVFGIIALLYLTGILLDPKMNSMASWGAFILLIAVVLYRFIYAPKAVLKGYGTRIARMPQVTSIETDGVYYRDKNQMSGFRPWSGYNKCREGQLVFAMRGPQRAFSVIPKRGLTSGQLDTLRNAVGMHISDRD